MSSASDYGRTKPARKSIAMGLIEESCADFPVVHSETDDSDFEDREEVGFYEFSERQFRAADEQTTENEETVDDDEKRNKELCMKLIAEKFRAFLLALHPRLGSHSHASTVVEDVMGMIRDFVMSDTRAQIIPRAPFLVDMAIDKESIGIWNPQQQKFIYRH